MSFTHGQLLQTFREEAKLSRDEFAAELGLTPGAVLQWDLDNNAIQAGRLNDIARILQLSPEKIRQLNYARLPDLNPQELDRQPEYARAGLLLKAFRDRAGLSQGAFGERPEIDRSITTIVSWEAGRSPIDISLLDSMRIVLSLDEDETAQLKSRIEESTQAIEHRAALRRPFQRFVSPSNRALNDFRGR